MINSKFSQWEKLVRVKLRESKIQFKERFRKFPIEVDGKIIEYNPDFVLDFDFNLRRYVIVEVHENLIESDVKKFRGFMDVYGRIYWLIMLVKDGELRRWNKFNMGEQALFHDIWVLNNIEIMIKQLENAREISKKRLLEEKASCPKCGKTAHGKFEIDELFGYRYNGKKPQSHCKTCRAAKHETNLIEDVFIMKPKKVNCPLCGITYMEKIRGERCCPR